MKRLVPILAVLLVAAGCGRAPSEPLVRVEDAVVNLPVLPGRPGAAYFTLRTNSDAMRLTAIASPRIGRIELHETASEGGVATMRPVANPTFSSDAPLIFAPGGRHAMLLDIDPSIRPGDDVLLTFSFDRALPVTVEAEVRGSGARPPAH